MLTSSGKSNINSFLLVIQGWEFNPCDAVIGTLHKHPFVASAPAASGSGASAPAASGRDKHSNVLKLQDANVLKIQTY
jgi:hypothetical protein